MTAPIMTRPRPGELAKQLRGAYETARGRMMTLSHLLEEDDPSDKYPADDPARNLDAFGRVLRALEIRTNAVPEMGIPASPLEAFGQNEQTAVAFGEWIQRRMRAAQGLPSTRAIYGSTDQAEGTVLQQISYDRQPYFKQIAPAVPISEVVAKTTPIVGGVYQAYFLSDVTAQERSARVPEGVEVPAVKLTGSNHTIRIRKFGRRLDSTYEQLRRVPIDIIALHIARMMVQIEVDKLAAIIDVIINGDGNSNGATVYNLTTLDTSVSAPTADKVTLKAYLKFKAKFRNPYKVTTMLGQEDTAVAVQLLNTGSANIPLVVMQAQGQNGPLGNIVPINNELGDAVRFGLSDDAIANKIIGMDSRFAIERITEVGGDITESTRWVERQVQSLVMTYDEGYAVIDSNAIKVLDASA